MFWRKSKDKQIISRNIRYGVAFGLVFSRFKEGIGESGDFKAYMTDPRVIDVIDHAHNEALRVLVNTNPADFFAHILLEQNKSWKKKCNADPLSQIAWGYNAARDIIFSFAPAIARVGKKNVEDVTGAMLQELIDVILEDKIQYNVELFVLPLRGVLEAFEDVKKST